MPSWHLFRPRGLVGGAAGELGCCRWGQRVGECLDIHRCRRRSLHRRGEGLWSWEVSQAVLRLLVGEAPVTL